MYREFYGMTEKPFAKTPDPRFLYLGRNHREALARLQYAVEERELALLTGEIGCGKTTLSRALMDSLGESCRFCFLFNPSLTPVELLRTICRSLGGKGGTSSKDRLVEEITGALYRHHEEGILPVVVIDEAQLVRERSVFEEIRLLTNFQLDDSNLLSVIIMGQPELRKRLRHHVYEPLRQRIGITFHLTPLEAAETFDYLDFRVETAGGRPGLFTREAAAMIHESARGIPRKINALANHALLVGFGRDAATIDASIVAEVREEAAI